MPTQHHHVSNNRLGVYTSRYGTLSECMYTCGITLLSTNYYSHFLKNKFNWKTNTIMNHLKVLNKTLSSTQSEELPPQALASLISS